MKLISSIIKDLKLSMLNYYTYIILVFVAAFVGASLYLIPEEFSNEPQIYVYADVEGPLAQLIQDELEGDKSILAASRDEIIEKMNENRYSIGLNIFMENNKMVMEFITQGYESERLKNILEAHMEGWAAIEAGYEMNSMITSLKSNNPDIPLNKGMLPVFLVLESAFMGLFMIAAYVFQDKEEGTIKAYAVSPATIWQYLLSKIVVFIIFSWISGLLATIFIMGTDVQYIPFILLLTSASIFGTVLGLMVAGLFSSFTKAMTGIFALTFVLGITVVSYYMPSFSPIYIKILPTYPMLFAFKEVLFPTGNIGLVYTNILGYLVASLVLFYISCKIYEKNLV